MPTDILSPVLPVATTLPRPGLRELARHARARTPALWWAGWAALALSLLWLALTWLDPRQLLGVSVWLKPWKFHVSVGVHLLTLALFAGLLPADALHRQRLRRLSMVAIATTLFELIYITGRAALGLPSHFAIATPFTSTMYTLMGLGAVLLTGCAGMLGWWILRARGFAHGDVLRRGVGWGLLLGWGLGTLAGAYLGAQTSHWVGGTPSDAGGSWLFHWSRDGGDLRVAHFFGLHAMQAIPLVAWIAAMVWPPVKAQRAWMAFAAAYVLLTIGTFVQAVAGRPFLAG